MREKRLLITSLLLSLLCILGGCSVFTAAPPTSNAQTSTVPSPAPQSGITSQSQPQTTASTTAPSTAATSGTAPQSSESSTRQTGTAARSATTTTTIRSTTKTPTKTQQQTQAPDTKPTGRVAPPTKKPTTVLQQTGTNATQPVISTNSPVVSAVALPKELRAVWVPFYDLPSAQGASKAQYQEKANAMMQTISSAGLNTVFVHVRPFADSIYPSALFPWSKYIGGTQGVNPGYDPLQILIDSAHRYKLSFHAWLNPFRVSYEINFSALAPNHPARQIREDGNAENDSDVFAYSGGIYFNPASLSVHRLILNGVREILDNYPVDGIHIDDYFYPTTDTAIDAKEYAAYRNAGGGLALDDWRRECVNSFVAALYSVTHARSTPSGAVLSISPSGNLTLNHDELYADIVQWATGGYADLIIPQLYYGFENEKLPFTKAADAWEDLFANSGTRLAWGLAAYKLGHTDSYAGTGRDEWRNNPKILTEQLTYTKKSARYSGYVLFAYSDVFETQDGLAALKLLSITPASNGGTGFAG